MLIPDHTARAVATLLLAVVACWAASSHAAPRIPQSDSEVLDTLPVVQGWSRAQQRAQRELLARPKNLPLALQAARSYLELARAQGDARYAGQALGVLQAWQPLSAATPHGVLVMHATVAQFLHDFDGAERTLRMALTQPDAAPQGWLTLATILRVRGRFADSDLACRQLTPLGQPLYATACLAENAGLRGQSANARASLAGLIASPAIAGAAQAPVRQWLWTTLAQVEELAGQPAAADAAYRQALAVAPDSYDLIAYSDFLLANGRAGEVPALLRAAPRSDAVVLRLAIAAKRGAAAGAASGQRDADELAARLQAAAARPGAIAAHAREQALFALDVQGDAPRALELARLGVELQREPVDLLLLARAAAAANDPAARTEARALAKTIGLRDARAGKL